MTRPWQAAEIALAAAGGYANAYTGVDVWADFVGPHFDDDGRVLRRPAFYDGGSTWRIRFAAPSAGSWRWRTDASVDDPGLRGVSGVVEVDPCIRSGAPSENRFHKHGFWRMSAGGRSMVHADGTPALLVADTAWALLWRATPADVKLYAADRRAKGFNAALLMSVQPDMDARGPRERGIDEGFDVGFEDLPTGHLNEPNIGYFQTLDGLLEVLVAHEIVPVLSPLFHGFGWKGLGVSGPVVPPDEYARYCRYLVARYGAAPAIYLVGADGWGHEPQVEAGGREVHAWDCYEQPTGVHYGPIGSNREHQDAEWLDFQSCQTGHSGAHIPERVADMWRNIPPKAVLNGEPTYEGTRHAGAGDGWWQGHEAWSNLCAGGTMGVVYGAANLWQWLLHADEPGFHEYFLGPPGSWRDALDYPGSSYVGLVGRILDGLPTTDMRPDYTTFHPRGLRAGDTLAIVYQEYGGPLPPPKLGDWLPHRYRIVDPRTGETVGAGQWAGGQQIIDSGLGPRVVIFYDGA
jgi:hypothetical protein